MNVNLAFKFQALKQRLDLADKLKGGLVENLKKAREHNEDLKFQVSISKPKL